MFIGEVVANRWRQGRWKFDVFISHAGEDKTFAHRLKEAIEGVGLSAFVDQSDLGGGDKGDLRILTAVQEAPVGLALLSKHFFQKEWPMRELNIIVGEGTLIPVLYNITRAEAEEEIRSSPQAQMHNPREWESFANLVKSTSALVNPSTSLDELPFVQSVVFSTVRHCVSIAGPKVALHCSNKAWAHRFVKRLEVAAMEIVRGFGKITVEESRKAGEWSSKMSSLADELVGC